VEAAWIALIRSIKAASAFERADAARSRHA
jgi:hypothetical protein